MKHIIVTVSLLCLLIASSADARRQPLPNPDFTKGDRLPANAKHDWNLGATGARGWMYVDAMVTDRARQIYITSVSQDSPADGVLKRGDVILGVSGKKFSYDPRTEFGKALTTAESEAGKGKLSVIRWRNGKAEMVEIKLPVIGTYSRTAPFNCPKSKRIVKEAAATLAKRIAGPRYNPNPIPRSLNGLGILAAGDPEHFGVLKKEVEWAKQFKAGGFKTWYYGYVIMFLSEYKLQTGDDSVMPAIKRLSLAACEGQSIVGSWGHNFAGKDGRLVGYGMMNNPGLTLTTGLILARKAGLENDRVDIAIDRSLKLLRFYVGKGSIPYGDHRAWMETHDDNGKNGIASLMFDLVGERDAVRFFSRMSLACHGHPRDIGHTGNFTNILWALPAVAKLGPNATGAWMNDFGAWYFDMARRPDGSFVHLGPPQLNNDAYANWDATGAYLLAYAVPNKTLFLTGKRAAAIKPLARAQAVAIMDEARGWTNKDRHGFYDKLSVDDLIQRLGSWSPVVRERAAIALARRRNKVDVTDRLIELLEKNRYSQYGACQALRLQGDRGGPAVDALLKAFRSDDLWLRILAAEALSGIGKPAIKAVPKMLERITKHDVKNDPRNMEQRYIVSTLFNRRGGLLGRSLDGVDREQLFNAVRAGLTNQDGRSRGTLGSVYQNLTFEQLKPLLPVIHEAIVKPAPSGIMFAHEIRMAGLKLFARHRVSEGMELLAMYAKDMKKHASEHRIKQVMNMLKMYGTHAKRVIPQLKATADYFQNREEGFPKRLSLDKARVVRQTIAEIEASDFKPELIKLNLKQ